MMLFVPSWCKSLKTDPSRDVCTYATWLKSSFDKKPKQQQQQPNKVIHVCYCSNWKCLVLWGVIRKQKRRFFKSTIWLLQDKLWPWMIG